MIHVRKLRRHAYAKFYAHPIDDTLEGSGKAERKAGNPRDRDAMVCLYGAQEGNYKKILVRLESVLLTRVGVARDRRRETAGKLGKASYYSSYGITLQWYNYSYT